jgi:diguanylate cyclase (GGDEF)-like protein
VLRELATVLRETVRDVDVAARWGGEEFVLVLPGTGADGAAHLAERIRERLRERGVHGPDGTPIPLTASFGIASFPEAGTPHELLVAADRALYEAKRRGKDRVELARQTLTA